MSTEKKKKGKEAAFEHKLLLKVLYQTGVTCEELLSTVSSSPSWKFVQDVFYIASKARVF